MHHEGHDHPRRRAVKGALAALVPLALFSVLVSACPGSLENPDQFLGCPDVPTKILGERCATAGCHGADTPQAGLDLTPDDGLAARMVDVDGVGCMGKIVDSAAPEQSLLYTKCLATNTCLTRMPQTGEVLSDFEEDCLLEYIQGL